MQPEEIKQMFLASSALQRCKPNDPELLSLKCTVDALTRRYVAENVHGQLGKNADPNMDIQEAMNIIGVSLNSLTQLELEHHPDGLADDDIKHLATVRRMAIQTIIDELLKVKAGNH